MGQVQVKVKGNSSVISASMEVFPLEVVQLLDVLARIEARRQARLRTAQKKEAS